MFLLLGLGPLGLAGRRVSKLLDFVENGDRASKSNEVVFPDPLVVDVPLQGELGNLSREGVRVLHGATHGSSSGSRRHSACKKIHC